MAGVEIWWWDADPKASGSGHGESFILQRRFRWAFSTAAAPLRTGALHVARDNQKVGRAAREAVNGRGDYHVAGGEGLHELGQAAAGRPWCR
jgi:hypothetical protein